MVGHTTDTPGMARPQKRLPPGSLPVWRFEITWPGILPIAEGIGEGP